MVKFDLLTLSLKGEEINGDRIIKSLHLAPVKTHIGHLFWKSYGALKRRYIRHINKLIVMAIIAAVLKGPLSFHPLP